MEHLLLFPLYQWGRLRAARRRYNDPVLRASDPNQSNLKPWHGLKKLQVRTSGQLNIGEELNAIFHIPGTNSTLLLTTDANEIPTISAVSMETNNQGLSLKKMSSLINKGSLFHAKSISASEAQLILKHDLGLDFYNYDLSKGSFTLIGKDTRFSADVSWDILEIGEFSTDPGTVTLITRTANEGIQFYALCAPIDPSADQQFCSSGDMETHPTLQNSPKVWPAKSNVEQLGALFVQDVMSNSLLALRLDADAGKVNEMGRLALPPGYAEDSGNLNITQIEFVGKKSLIVRFDEGETLNFRFQVDPKGIFQFYPESIIFPDSKTVNIFEGNTLEKETLISLSDGPTVKEHNRELNEWVQTPFLWSESFLSNSRAIPLNINYESPQDQLQFVLLGNNEQGQIIWYSVSTSWVHRYPYFPAKSIPTPSFEGTQNNNQLPLSQIKDLINSHPTPSISILDPIPSSTFINALDVQRGSVSFSMELIPEIGFQINYQGGALRPSKAHLDVPQIGTGGWSTRSPTFIGVDRKKGQNLSKWEPTFFLFINSQVYELQEIQQNGEIRNFLIKQKETEDSSDLNSNFVIEYHEKNERWVVSSGEGETLEFGGISDSVSNIKWGWQAGSWSREMGRVAMEWALVKSSKAGNPSTSSNFSYREIEGEPDPGHKITKALLLTKFQSGDGGHVHFNWAEEGRLDGFELNLSGKKQSVKFQYDGNSGLLSTIEQNFGSDGSWTPLINFQYDFVHDEEGLMSGITVPDRELEVNFKYNKVAASTKEDVFLDIPGNALFSAHGTGISYFDNGESLWAWNAGDGTKVNLREKVGGNGFEPGQDVVLVAKDNVVIRLARNSHRAHLSIYRFTPETQYKNKNDTDTAYPWTLVTEKDMNISEHYRITLHSSGLLLTITASARTLNLHEWNGQEFMIVSSAQLDYLPYEESDLIITADRVVWFNIESHAVFWILRGIGGKWTDRRSSQISPPNWGQACSDFFISKFDLGWQGKRDFRKFFDQLQFQVDNVGRGIIAQSCYLAGEKDKPASEWKLATRSSLFELNEEGELVLASTLEKERETVLSLKMTQVKYNEGVKKDITLALTYTYDKDKGHFSLHLSAVGYEDHDAELTKEFLNSQKYLAREMFLFEPTNMTMAVLPPSRILAGNSTLFLQNENGGPKWDERPWNKTAFEEEALKKFSLDLGRNFQLERKDNNGSITLVQTKDGGNVFDFGRDAAKLQIQYPGYFISTKDSPKVINTYRVGGSSDEQLLIEDIQGNYQHSESSPDFLVTKTGDSGYRVQWTGWLPSRPAIVVDYMEVKGPPKKTLQVTRLEYDDPVLTADKNLAWRNVTVVRGPGDKSVQGWLKYTFDPYKYKDGVMVNAYSGTGIFLQRTDNNGVEMTEQERKEKKKQEAPLGKEGALWDKYGKMVISKLSPFNATQCQIGYIGFQSYEENGGDCRWQFQKDSIITGMGDSLTGSNYLKLTNNDSSSLTFRLPLVQNQSYVAGCWVRGGNFPDSTNQQLSSPLLTAWVENEGLGFMSKIILSRGPWRYLRVKVAAEELNPLWSNVLGRKLDEFSQNQHFLQVRVESGDAESRLGLDVDSCLIAPTFWNSELNIYEEGTPGLVTEKVFGHTGLISSYIYDNEIGTLGEPVVMTDPMGQILRIQLPMEPKNGVGDSILAVESIDTPGWLHDFSLSPNTGFQKFGKHGLIHKETGSSFLPIYGQDKIEPDRLMIRIKYHLISGPSSLTVNMQGRPIKISRAEGAESTFLKIHDEEVKLKSPMGTLFIAALGQENLFVFSREGIIFQSSNYAKLGVGIGLETSGIVLLNHVVLLPNPAIKLSYKNMVGQEVQSGVIVEEGIVVSERIYDEQGRSVATTKPTIIPWKSGDKILGYRENWVTSFSLKDQKMEGEVVNLNPDCGSNPFNSLQYEETPIDGKWKVEGRPGEQFSAKSSYANYYSDEGDAYLETLFPKRDGFYYRKRTAGSSLFTETIVYSTSLHVRFRKEFPVATLTHSPGGRTTLVTYDYDSQGRLVASLPPLHHSKHNTLLQGKSWREIGYDQKTATLGSFTEYNEKDQKIRVTTPEMGTTEYIYDEFGNIHLMVRKSSEETNPMAVYYMDYEEGLVLKEMGTLQGYSYTSGENITGGERRTLKQMINLGNLNGPLSLNQLVATFSHSEEKPYVQIVENQMPQNKPVSESTLTWTANSTEPLLTPTVRYVWSPNGERLIKIYYALEETSIVYSYNAMGRVAEVYLINENTAAEKLASFDYDFASGNVAQERLFQPSSTTYIRNSKNSTAIQLAPIATKISYNAPGFPTNWENFFFKEEIGYESNGYGDTPLGEPAYPTSLRWTTKFSNPLRVTEKLLKSAGINPRHASICHSALVDAGYLSNNGNILRFFVPGLDIEALPLICNVGDSAKNIGAVLGNALSLQSHGYSLHMETKKN